MTERTQKCASDCTLFWSTLKRNRSASCGRNCQSQNVCVLAVLEGFKGTQNAFVANMTHACKAWLLNQAEVMHNAVHTREKARVSWERMKKCKALERFHIFNHEHVKCAKRGKNTVQACTAKYRTKICESKRKQKTPKVAWTDCPVNENRKYFAPWSTANGIVDSKLIRNRDEDSLYN